MPYRLVTFDANGKIVAVSPKSFQDTDAPIFTMVRQNPNLYGFIDEDLLPTGTDLALLERGLDATESYSYDGNAIRVNQNTNRSYFDPRVEASLIIRNPTPYMQFGSPVVQDLTRTQVFFNQSNKNTRPTHSSEIKKFGSSSGKFTRSNGLSGGGIYVTNINKRTFGSTIAPHNVLGGGSTASYSMELFFRPSSTATSNNFTLLQKGPTGASANWKLTFDNSSGFLQFAWQQYGTSGGYNYSENITNTSGITALTWHHVAVAVIRNSTVGASAGHYLISGYWNGANVFSRAVTGDSFPEFRYDFGIYIGNNHLGTEAFDGHIDSVRIMESGTTGGPIGSYGFLPYGSGTIGVPTLIGFTLNSDVCFVMGFNNLPDAPFTTTTDGFYAESSDKITGVVSRIINYTGTAAEGFTFLGFAEVGIRDIYQYQRGLTGPTAPADNIGFSLGYGPLAIPYNNPIPYGATGFTAHGYDYAWNVFSVIDDGATLTDFRSNYKYNSLYEYSLERMAFIEGTSAVVDGVSGAGSCGDVFRSRLGKNPFGRLFASGNCYGVSANHTTLFIDPLDAEMMEYIMSGGFLTTQGICYASYTFTDALGFDRTVTGTEINNLRLDILDYYNKLATNRRDVKDQIDVAASISDVKIKKLTKTSGVPTIPALDGGGEIFGP